MSTLQVVTDCFTVPGTSCGDELVTGVWTTSAAAEAEEQEKSSFRFACPMAATAV